MFARLLWKMSHCVIYAGNKLMILLPLFPRGVPPHLVNAETLFRMTAKIRNWMLKAIYHLQHNCLRPFRSLTLSFIFIKWISLRLNPSVQVFLSPAAAVLNLSHHSGCLQNWTFFPLVTHFTDVEIVLLLPKASRRIWTWLVEPMSQRVALG